MDRSTGAQHKLMKKYMITFDIVIQPNRDTIAITDKMQDITPMMKSPYELMIFLLCLELLNRNGEPGVEFVFVSSNTKVQIIALPVKKSTCFNVLACIVDFIYKTMNTVKSQVQTHLVWKHMQTFSDCLWRGFLILIYCDFSTKSWFPN